MNLFLAEFEVYLLIGYGIYYKLWPCQSNTDRGLYKESATKTHYDSTYGTKDLCMNIRRRLFWYVD